MSRFPRLFSRKRRIAKPYLVSLITGYGLAAVCAALLVTLWLQRYSAIDRETLRYEIQRGTRVVIDLSNGRVMERGRSETAKKHAPASDADDHHDSPEKPADDDDAPLPDTSQDSESSDNITDEPETVPPIRTVNPASETDFRDEGKPVLGIIIKGAGMSAVSTEEAIAMPKDITIGFSPYAPSLSMHANMAAEKGHDILLHLPMESGDLSMHDPGPYSLLTGLSPDENLRRLSIVLALTVRYAGVYTEADENFSLAGGSFNPVMQELGKRRVAMIYGGGMSRLSFFQNAEQADYPVIGADTHIDSVFEENAVTETFDALLERAKKRGYAMVIAASYPVTLKMLTRLLPRAEKEGVLLKPVSYFFDKLYPDGAPSDDTASTKKDVTAPKPDGKHKKEH